MPFSSSKNSHFQNEAKYKTFLLKTRFFSPRIKHHSLINGFTLSRDCKTVRMFAYSSAREQLNKRSWAKLKRRSPVGCARLACFSSVKLLRNRSWKKTDCFFSLRLASLRQLENGLFLVIKSEEFKLTNGKVFLENRSKCLNERCSDEGGIHQAPVVQKVDSAIQRIHHYPVDSAIGFPNTYLLDSDLTSG